MLLFTIATTAPPAHATVFGGHFPYSCCSLDLPYTYMNSPYQTQVSNAAASWYNTTTAIAPRLVNSLTDSKVDYYGTNFDYGYAAHTDLFCTDGTQRTDCVYYYANITLSTASGELGGVDDFTRQKVACHEMGHSFGLAHPTNSSLNAVMKQGILPYNTPQAYDVSETNTIYPRN